MNIKRQQSAGKKQSGMTLVEIMIALALLSVGMLALFGIFASAMQGNNKSNKDTSATMLAQMVMEQINAQAANAVAPFQLTDCAFPVANQFLINTQPGGATLYAGNTANTGSVDWTQAPPTVATAVTAGYDMVFVSCGAAGQQIPYEVRWNIQAISGNSRLVTVSAKQRSSRTGGVRYAVPVTLRSIGGV